MSVKRPWEGLEEPQPRPYLRAPHCSPDGERVAFACGGDLWCVPRSGGDARLLVAHGGYNDRPRFSPDGSRLAFTSRRTGNGDVYAVDLAGTSVRRLTWHDGYDGLECWSTDGEWLWFTSGRSGRGAGLYQVDLSGGTPILVFEEPYESFYNLSFAPDGVTLALNNNGDAWWRRGPNPHGASQIWLARAEGAGRALTGWRKVVDAPCRNLWPMWRPNGQGIYFVSDRDGVENLWYQAVGDPEAEQITRCRDGRMLRPAITPDGREVLFERDFGIWSVDLATGGIRPMEIRVHPVESRTPTSHHRQSDRLGELALSPDGRKVAFVAHGKLFADFADKTDRPRNDAFPVSDTEARESQPAWYPNGNALVFLSDRDGESAVYRYDFVAREEKRLTDDGGPCYAPQISPDGRWLAYYRQPDEIRLLEFPSLRGANGGRDQDHGFAAVPPLPPFITGRDREFIRFPIPFAWPEHPSFVWSPDSRWLAFAGRDERFFANVYVQRLEEESARPVSFLSNIELSDLHWSPDGRFILFSTGHHRVESQVARVDLRPPAAHFPEEEFAQLFEAGGGSETPEEESSPAEVAPKPSTAPEPVEISFEGIRERLRFLTPISLPCAARRISPDGKHLVYAARINGKSNLWSRSLEEARRDEPAVQLTATSGAKGAVWFAPDGKKIHYLDDGRIQWRPFPRGDSKPLEVTAAFDVDFHREKRHAFREAWSLLRDQFYDPSFHGADWQAHYLRFWPVVLGAVRPEEVQELLNLMVGELRASHLGASGSEEPYSDGYIGLEFDPAEQASSSALRIREVLVDGPAAVVPDPARIGEYLVAVDGEPVGPALNLWQRLQHRVGRRMRLSLNGVPEKDGAREIAVQPIGAGEYDRLCYRGWVRSNATYVEREGFGRLGYVHVRAMSFECYTQLLLDLDSQTHEREGVVVDVRFNGGGYVAPFILDLLQRRSFDRSVYRDTVSTSSVNLAGGRILDRPTIVLTNEHSGSNTEMFSEGYRTLGLGKVVGRPTQGAVIWTWGWQLLDGTYFRLPRIRVQTLSGENLEGAARPVDVDVEQPVGEWHPDPARRRDRQLDAAVRELLAQIDRMKG